MKLPQTPRYHRGMQGHAGQAGMTRGTRAIRGLNADAGPPRRFRQLAALLAVSSLVLMGASPAMAEGEPVDPAAASAPAEVAPAPEPAPAAEPAPAPAPEPAPAPAPEPAPAPAPAPAPVQDQPAPAAPSAPETPAAPAPEAPAAEPQVAAADALPEAPYLRWRVADANDALVGDTSITVEGPRNDAVADDGNDSQWVDALSETVKDNSGQPDYVGADLDPAAGLFLVKQITHELDQTLTHDISLDEHFRVRPGTAPEGFTIGGAAEWLALDVLASADAPVANLVLAAVDQPRAEEPATPTAEEELAAEEELISPLAVIEADCVGDANCAGMRMTNVVVGGSATAADWALQAVRNNTNLDQYDFTSGQTRTVPRNVGGSTRAVYTLSATAAPAVQALYDTTFACTSAAPSGHSSNSTNISTSARTVSFGYRSNANTAGDPSERYAYCTFTHRLATPATIIVQTGSDRSGVTDVTDLAGVVLYLNTGNNSPSGTRPDGVAGDGAGWARCVSIATGECTFLVPNAGTGGANRDVRFWVVQPVTGVPTGWYTNPSLRTGDGSSDGSSTAYNFQTATQLRGGQTYRSTSEFMYNPSGSSAKASGGVWQQSRDNPTFPQRCGVKVALVMDLSGSVEDSVDDLKLAADTFTNALVGTQSSMALFSFASGSPAEGASQNYPTLTPVATQAQADAFTSRYDSWDADGGTNWDRGLAVPAAASATINQYDLAVVITDGNPTYYGPGPSGSGSANRFIEGENGIFSANALKAAGTRVLAFGVGAGATGTNTSLNLRAISGPTAFNGTNGATADYMQTMDYELVGETLRNFALGNCAGQVTVTKMVVPNTADPGTIDGAAPAVAGWEFTASAPGNGLTLPDPPVRTTTADGTGTVAFPLGFEGNTPNANVTITETQQAGYTLVPVGGQNAVCRNLETNTSVPLIENPTDGFRINVPSSQPVNCIVYNRAPSVAATVSVTKKWVVDDGLGNSTTYLIPGDEGLLPDGLAAQLKLTGPVDQNQTNQDWGAVRANYVAGDPVTINEVATIDEQKLPGCTMGTQLVTQMNADAISSPVPFTTDLPQGPNTFEITNAVTCETTLTLVKSLTIDNGGTSVLEDWILTADGPTAGVTGATNDPTVTNRTILPGQYALDEDGPVGYTASDWTCATEAGELPVTAGTMTVPMGASAQCTIKNDDKPGAVSWSKVAMGETELLAGSEWEIVGTSPDVPAQAIIDCVDEPCGGLDQDPAVGKFLLEGLSWNEYTVTETKAPPGYVGGAEFTFTVDGTTAGPVIAHGPVTNDQQNGVALPLTGGMSSEMFTLWGTGIGLLAVLMGVVYWRRFNRPLGVQ